MGRKIPGRKHRGVKDPEKQQAVRFAKIKDKINAPPSNIDDQQIPKTLTRIIELKNKVKEGHYNKKKKKDKQNNDNENSKQVKKFKGKPEKAIPTFERLPGESDREFKHRMNRICSGVIREAAFEDKYKVDIIRDENGEVKVQKRPKDELEVLIKKVRKEEKQKNKKGKKKKNSMEEEKPRLTKSQKWALKKAAKKKKKVQENDIEHSFEPMKDEIKFGDIVHAPPSLVVPRKVEKLQQAPRPGQKPLLLKSMLSGNNDHNLSKQKKTTVKSTTNGISNTSKTINKKGKRKDLPNALRRQLDKQQKDIIEAYKMLKSKKYVPSV